MISWTVEVSGFPGLAAQRSQMRRAIAEVGKAAQIQGWSDWIEGRAQTKLRDRLGFQAFALYQFSARSAQYQKRQRKILGATRAYFSPRGGNFAGLAQSLADLAAGRGNMLAVIQQLRRHVRSHGGHLVDLVHRPGGWRVRAAASVNAARSELTLPGARILNRIRPPHGERYRRELLDLARGGGRDRNAIAARFDVHWRSHLRQLVLATRTPVRIGSAT